jgi:hypothetical protein
VIENRLYFVFYSQKICPHLPPNRLVTRVQIFPNVSLSSTGSPLSYQSKVSAHVAKAIADKPQLVQISTAYGNQKEGSAVLPRNKYTAIRDEKPKSKDEATRPEFKVCKYATEAIIAEGSEVGTMQKVCVNPDCAVHHPKKATSGGAARDAQWKAEQEKRRKEEAIASATGARVRCRASRESARRKPDCYSGAATWHQEDEGSRLNRQVVCSVSPSFR